MKHLRPICFSILLLLGKLSYSQIDTTLFYGVFKYNNEFQTSILYFQKGGICVDTIHGAVSSIATGTYFFSGNKIIATFIKSDNSITKRTFFFVQGIKGKLSLEEEFWYKSQKKTTFRKERSGVKIYRKIADIGG